MDNLNCGKNFHIVAFAKEGEPKACICGKFKGKLSPTPPQKGQK